MIFSIICEELGLFGGYAVIIMFVISTTGSRPTILNYERVLQNRYAEWEQQLSDREQVIREKERELLIAE